MNSKNQQKGFSLTEVLIAVGTLAVGMIFIGGTFLAGVTFSTVAAERTTAAVVAGEAFAKIRLYAAGEGTGINEIDFSLLSSGSMIKFSDVIDSPGGAMPIYEYAYPSDPNTRVQKQYYWSAICRLVPPLPSRLVQVTVFVCRKAGAGTKYYGWQTGTGALIDTNDTPTPVPVTIETLMLPTDKLVINGGDSRERTFINSGSIIVDDENGDIYRVAERNKPTEDDRVIRLDKLWQGGNFTAASPGLVWVIPPPVNGGRYPCIAVYQQEIKF